MTHNGPFTVVVQNIEFFTHISSVFPNPFYPEDLLTAINYLEDLLEVYKIDGHLFMPNLK